MSRMGCRPPKSDHALPAMSRATPHHWCSGRETCRFPVPGPAEIETPESGRWRFRLCCDLVVCSRRFSVDVRSCRSRGPVAHRLPRPAAGVLVVMSPGVGLDVMPGPCPRVLPDADCLPMLLVIANSTSLRCRSPHRTVTPASVAPHDGFPSETRSLVLTLLLRELEKAPPGGLSGEITSATPSSYRSGFCSTRHPRPGRGPYTRTFIGASPATLSRKLRIPRKSPSVRPRPPPTSRLRHNPWPQPVGCNRASRRASSEPQAPVRGQRVGSAWQRRKSWKWSPLRGSCSRSAT
jgi:hypothetical protein